MFVPFSFRTASASYWPVAHRFGVWFIIVYVLWFASPFNGNPTWVSFIEWVGKHTLEMKDMKKIMRTGSGDTSFDYAFFFVRMVGSFVIALILSLLIRKRLNYDLLWAITQTGLRYYLASFMFSYGFAKVYEGQFRYPSYTTLEQTYGDSSPMGIVWNLMGLSRPYAFFGGAAEVLGGVLLLFRKTKTLGALVVIGVMTNVVMLNFSYDIPVKLFSSFLLSLAFVVLIPDFRALYRFFIQHTPAALETYTIVFTKKWQRISRIVLKIIMIGTFGVSAYEMAMYRPSKDNVLRGAYTVEEFEWQGNPLPPLTTDSVRWNKFIVENWYSEVRSMNNKRQYVSVDVLEKDKKMILKNMNDTTQRDTLAYQLTKNILTLNGYWQGQHIRATLHRKTYDDYVLTNRGFHWINEYPYNQ